MNKSSSTLAAAEVDELVRQAQAGRENAVAPFSGFRVGAAVRVADGTIVRGCNIENSTYGLTVCAERVAVFAALAAGHRKFDAVSVVSQSEQPATPCGACRQILWEFCGNVPVILSNLDGERRQFMLAELFPEPFDFRLEES